MISDEVISLGGRVRRLAAERPGAPAVTCDDDTLTWEALDRRTNRLARGLEARGVGGAEA